MVSKELIFLLTSFSPKELKRFEDFLDSHYLNTNRKLLDLFRILKPHYPLFNNPKLTKENLFNELYPSKKYADPTIRNLLSDLNEAGESFLAFETFANDSFQKKDVLLHVLRERNMVSHFSKGIRELSERLESDGLCSSYFEKRFKLEDNKINFDITYGRNNNKDSIENRIHNISSSTKFLTLNFLMEIIERHIKTHFYKEKYNISEFPAFLSKIFECINIDSILATLEDDEYKGILMLYSCLYKMHNEPDNKKIYFDYKGTYQNCFRKLNKDERAFHNLYLINYCVLRVNDLDHTYNYANDLFKFYKELIEQEYYKTSGNQFLPANLYRAILVTALDIGQYSWAEQFMKSNYSNIHPKDRDNMINLGFFLFYGNTGQYEKAQNYLNNIKLDYFIFKYDEHLLKIKVFYELGMYEEGLCALRSFIEFIHNNTFESSSRKQMYLTFTKYAMKLFSCKLENNENELGYWEHHLHTVDNIIYKEWLLEKFGLELAKHNFSEKQLA